MCKELIYIYIYIYMIFIRGSISIKEHNFIMLIKIQKSEKDEPQSLFFQLKKQTLWLVFILIIAILTNSNKLYYFVFYLVNLYLIIQQFFLGSIFILRDKLLLITIRYTCRKKVIKFLAPFLGNNLIFLVQIPSRKPLGITR